MWHLLQTCSMPLKGRRHSTVTWERLKRARANLSACDGLVLFFLPCFKTGGRSSADSSVSLRADQMLAKSKRKCPIDGKASVQTSKTKMMRCWLCTWDRSTQWNKAQIIGSLPRGPWQKKIKNKNLISVRIWGQEISYCGWLLLKGYWNGKAAHFY